MVTEIVAMAQLQKRNLSNKYKELKKMETHGTFDLLTVRPELNFSEYDDLSLKY